MIRVTNNNALPREQHGGKGGVFLVGEKGGVFVAGETGGTKDNGKKGLGKKGFGKKGKKGPGKMGKSQIMEMLKQDPGFQAYLQMRVQQDKGAKGFLNNADDTSWNPSSWDDHSHNGGTWKPSSWDDHSYNGGGNSKTEQNIHNDKNAQNTDEKNIKNIQNIHNQAFLSGLEAVGFRKGGMTPNNANNMMVSNGNPMMVSNGNPSSATNGNPITPIRGMSQYDIMTPTNAGNNMRNIITPTSNLGNSKTPDVEITQVTTNLGSNANHIISDTHGSNVNLNVNLRSNAFLDSSANSSANHIVNTTPPGSYDSNLTGNDSNLTGMVGFKSDGNDCMCDVDAIMASLGLDYSTNQGDGSPVKPTKNVDRNSPSVSSTAATNTIGSTNSAEATTGMDTTTTTGGGNGVVGPTTLPYINTFIHGRTAETAVCKRAPGNNTIDTLDGIAMDGGPLKKLKYVTTNDSNDVNRDIGWLMLDTQVGASGMVDKQMPAALNQTGISYNQQDYLVPAAHKDSYDINQVAISGWKHSDSDTMSDIEKLLGW